VDVESRILPPQRVFITGANGCIGRALAKRARDQGADVCGVDMSANPAWDVNCNGTGRLLTACREGSTCRFVHISSVAAYGCDCPDRRDSILPAALRHDQSEITLFGSGCSLAGAWL